MSEKSTVLLPKLFVGLLLAGTLTSCALNPEGLHHGASQNNDIEIYGTTAGIRGIMLQKNNSNSTYCAEPQPDAAVSESMSENVGVSQGEAGSENEGASESVGETSLGGRSVNVLLTREIFYRTCEFISNSRLSEDSKLALFKVSLQSVVDLNNSDFGTGSAIQKTISQDKESPLEDDGVSDDDDSSNDADSDNDSNNGN
jgi:hypothetical protein